MAAKGGVAFPDVVAAFIRLVVGVILAAVFLALGWLAFAAIAGESLGISGATLSGTGLGIIVGAVAIGVSIVVGATVLSLKK